MKFRIPFTFSGTEVLKKRSKFFLPKLNSKKESFLDENLKNAGASLSKEEYIAICKRGFLINFALAFIISTTMLILFRINLFYLYGIGIALLFSGFIFFSQIVYPKIYVSKRQRNIEKSLIPALEDILVQLSSGIPLFSVMVNISSADYGELSAEFQKAVKRINSGEPEEIVLEDLAKKNPSIFFRRALWQIDNGMKAGSDISIVIKDSIKALSEEQLIQIQNYGNRLNPLVVFYMLIAVIIPALSVTFLTIISSMINLQANMIYLLFIGIFVFVMFIQIMFLGILRSRRPSLL